MILLLALFALLWAIDHRDREELEQLREAERRHSYPFRQPVEAPICEAVANRCA